MNITVIQNECLKYFSLITYFIINKNKYGNYTTELF